MASNPPRRCVIAGCDNELSPRSRLDECPACRANLISWLKRRPAEVLERRLKLNLYDSRMQAILPGSAEKLSENSQLRVPANYKPQSRKGRALVKSIPKRRARDQHGAASA